MSKTMILVLVAVVVLSMLVVGCKARSPEKKAEHMVNKISSKLNLNDVQKAELNGIKNELLQMGLEMHEEHENMHSDLSEQLLSDRIDVDEVKALINEKKASVEELIDTAVDRLAEFHATLTSEQKELLVAEMETCKNSKWKNWHH